MMQRHKLEGVVLDSENNPIEGVSVKMYRGPFGQIDLIGEVQTKQDGRYEIGFDGGSSIRIVRYDYLFHGLDSCHPGLVTNISGVQDHILNKVMYKAGMAYDKDELLDILSTYERVYFIDVSHQVTLDEIKSKYRGNLGMIKYIDELTKQRYSQVIELYDKRA
jgi:5-hydroxyisourate hydrolase-like protein (transthyretin family)